MKNEKEKSVDLQVKNVNRPTFLRKWLKKREGFGIIEYKNCGNTVVVPYLRGIETSVFLRCTINLFFDLLYLA